MFKTILSASALSLALLSGAASAATIANGSFEIGTNPGGFTTLANGDITSITDWTVGPTDIDYIGNYWQAQNGVRSIDLSGNALGSISTTITNLIANVTYEVSFWMSGNPDGDPRDKQMKVTLATPSTTATYNYDIDASGTTRANMKWQEFVLRFTATSATSLLTFAADSGGPGAACCFGPALDNVSIAAVPLPAGGLLLLGALGGIAALRRRKTV